MDPSYRAGAEAARVESGAAARRAAGLARDPRRRVRAEAAGDPGLGTQAPPLFTRRTLLIQPPSRIVPVLTAS